MRAETPGAHVDSSTRERIARALPKPARTMASRAIGAANQAGYARTGFSGPFGRRPRIWLGVCAIFRDEASYLAEWVTFHRLQGVDHFWLYDNGSKDNWGGVLRPEIESKIVDVTPWSQHPGQLSAYAHCLSRHSTAARWIAFIDLDEFLFSPAFPTLRQALDQYRFVPGVCANWRLFGLGGNTQPSDGLVIENHVWRVRDDRPVNQHVKSVVYPRKTVIGTNPHIFNHTYGKTVGEVRDPQSGPFRDPPTADVLRINHYAARSLAEARYKYGRPDAHLGETSRQRWLDKFLIDALDDVDGTQVPRDEVRDDTMRRFVQPLRHALASRQMG